MKSQHPDQIASSVEHNVNGCCRIARYRSWIGCLARSAGLSLSPTQPPRRSACVSITPMKLPFPGRHAVRLALAALVSFVLALTGCATLDERQREWIFQPSDRTWAGATAAAEGRTDPRLAPSGRHLRR